MLLWSSIAAAGAPSIISAWAEGGTANTSWVEQRTLWFLGSRLVRYTTGCVAVIGESWELGATKVKVLLTSILAGLLLAGPIQADSIFWTMPTQDVGGEYIDPSLLYAKLYWGYDNSEYFLSGPMPPSPVSLDDVPPGCYHLRFTAVRTDTNQESAPSESVYYCTGSLPPAPPTGVGID